MEVKEILELTRAGFTAQQIAALVGMKEDAQDPAPAADPEPAQDPAPAADPEPSQDPAPSNDPRIDAISESLKELKQMITIGNINGSKQPPAQTVDDILAQVINPPRPKED